MLILRRKTFLILYPPLENSRTRIAMPCSSIGPLGPVKCGQLACVFKGQLAHCKFSSLARVQARLLEHTQNLMTALLINF